MLFRSKATQAEAEALAELDKAKADLEIAKDKQVRAESITFEDAKEEAIVDEEFAYLNEFIQAIRDAETAKTQADEAYDVAEADLAEKSETFKNVNARYLAVKAQYDKLLAEKEAEEAIKDAQNQGTQKPAGQESVNQKPAQTAEQKKVASGKVRTGDPAPLASLMVTMSGSIAAIGAALKRRKK